jgi:hypothetical protein
MPLTSLMGKGHKQEQKKNKKKKYASFASKNNTKSYCLLLQRF